MSGPVDNPELKLVQNSEFQNHGHVPVHYKSSYSLQIYFMLLCLLTIVTDSTEGFLVL